MRTAAVLAGIVLITVPGAAAQGLRHLGASARRHLLDTDSFTVARSTRDIPAAVKVAFSNEVREPRFIMANPGERFQDSCDVETPPLPYRRLAFVALSSDHCLLHYELGGGGRHVVLLKMVNGKVVDSWHAVTNIVAPYDTLDELRNAVRKGELRDDRSFYW